MVFFIYFISSLLYFGSYQKIIISSDFFQKSDLNSTAFFPDTYFLADKRKKSIIDFGIILKTGQKEIPIPQEDLHKWISVEIIKKECPEIILPRTEFCSVFDLAINENDIEDFIENNISLNLFTEPGKKLLIKDNILKIKKSIAQAEENNIIEIPLLASSESSLNIEILGIGKTSFAGSSENRITNIEIGSAKISGTVIAPKEEFSVLKTIGQVSAEARYKPEANIRGGKTVMALGGGLCQVSTTLFRAALNAGMKITRRANHSYPIEYYSPQGTDAAIAYPYTDFRFINDTESSIFIQRKIENFQLVFEIYGKNDGRIVKINGPHILEKKEDGSLKTILHQEVYRGGDIWRKDSFFSFYRPKSEFPHE